MRGSIFTSIVTRSLAALIALLLMIPCGCGGGSGSDGSASDAIDLLFCAMFPWTCFGNSSNGNSSNNNTSYTYTSSEQSYIVGGTVSGLSGSGLVLQNNGSDDLMISENGTFTFVSPLPSGRSYTISVKTQPQSPSETCTAGNNTGIITGTNVTNISVICSTNAYTLGGAINGLIGPGLVLQNNGGDGLAISSNSAFIFATAVADGALYKVSVKTHPTGQTCLVSNGIGTLAGANVTNVSVVCLAWTRQMGVAGQVTSATGVAVDSSNNVYVAGYTMGGLDGNTLTGVVDFFLVKYDSTGNKIRTTQMGVTGKNPYVNGVAVAAGVAVDSNGNVYVTGYTSNGLDGNTFTGWTDFFLVKYDSAGNKIRTTQMGVEGKDTWATGVAVDSSNNVYVTGHTLGGLDGNTLTGVVDFFLVKYDSAGNKIRTKQMGVEGQTHATGVAVNSSNNVYVTGYTSGGLDGNTLAGTEDFFLVKYDSAGNKIRTTQMGVENQTHATGVAVDSSNNVYVTGYTSCGLDGNTLTGVVDFFLVKYDSAGNKIRTTQMGVAGKATYATSVAVDSSNNVYVTGHTFGGLDGSALTGVVDSFLVKYDSAGNKIRTTQMGIAGKGTWATGVAFDSSNNVYVAGAMSGGLYTRDFLLTKYDASAIIQ